MKFFSVVSLPMLFWHPRSFLHLRDPKAHELSHFIDFGEKMNDNLQELFSSALIPMSLMSNDLITHPSLLLRLRNSDDNSAWVEFVQVYGPMVFGYCRIRKLQESDAADVSQEVFTRLARAMAEFEYKPELGRFRDWLGKVIHRELLRFWEKRKSTSRVQNGERANDEAVDDGAIWIEHFHSEILRKSLANIQCEFSFEAWSAFKLSWLENIPVGDVALQLEVPIESVYVAKSRVLKRLRNEVARLSEDLPIADTR